MSRFATAAWLVYLETTPGGLTLARLHALSRALGASAGGLGQARAILAYLRYIRYIEPLPREGDARLQRYRTSEKVGPVFRERFRQELGFSSLIDPALAEVAARIGEPGVFDRYFSLVTETGLAMMQEGPTRRNPIDLFWKRTSGMVVVSQLMQCGEPGDTVPPRGPLAYTLKDLARRCGTSRMQVRNLLDVARRQGHLIQTGDGRERISEELRDGFERFVAVLTSIYLGAARITLRELSASAGTEAETGL